MTGSLYRADVTPLPKQGKAKPARPRPLRRFSVKKASTFDLRDEMRRRVIERDGGCLLADVSPCVGRLTYHHRRKESQGGALTMRNGACLCWGHNAALEHHAGLAAYAHSIGLVVRRGDPEWESLGRRRSA